MKSMKLIEDVEAVARLNEAIDYLDDDEFTDDRTIVTGRDRFVRCCKCFMTSFASLAIVSVIGIIGYTTWNVWFAKEVNGDLLLSQATDSPLGYDDEVYISSYRDGWGVRWPDTNAHPILPDEWLGEACARWGIPAWDLRYSEGFFATFVLSDDFCERYAGMASFASRIATTVSASEDFLEHPRFDAHKFLGQCQNGTGLVDKSLLDVYTTRTLSSFFSETCGSRYDEEHAIKRTEALHKYLHEVLESDSKCRRRNAVTRAAGVIRGFRLDAIEQREFVHQTLVIKIGSDAGEQIFVPREKIEICEGDSVRWIDNSGGPHKIVLNEKNASSSVIAEKSTTTWNGRHPPLTSDIFTAKFNAQGDYEYHCTNHIGTGLHGRVIVD